MINVLPTCPECSANVLYECLSCNSTNYPAQATPPVSDRFAARLAMELECVLEDRHKYRDTAIQVLAAYYRALEENPQPVAKRECCGACDECHTFGVAPI